MDFILSSSAAARAEAPDLAYRSHSPHGRSRDVRWLGNNTGVLRVLQLSYSPPAPPPLETK